MSQDKLDYFRPKARHIFTIGKDLIKDDFSALIELIKNAYDADADNVFIEFVKLDNEDKIKIIIKDDGHGMTEDDIRGKWLIPSTDNKKDTLKTPKGRTFQGQKGIGRYAASVLGDLLKLETIKDGKKTIVKISWNEFNNNEKYLDEIHLDIKNYDTNEKNGTYIEIIGNIEKLNIWTEKQISRLENDLAQLISPFSNINDFEIFLYKNIFLGLEKKEDDEEAKIKNFKQTDFFDYKISGYYKKETNIVNFTYINSDTKEEINGLINIDLKKCYFDDDIKRNNPGDFEFEFLIIDRDPIKEREEISKIMGNQRELQRSKAKKEFDEHSGIKLYRGGFRIKPYGEKSNDWLNLNSRRVNDPTLRLSSNQVLGFVKIGTEEESNLSELPSRGGLIENEYFWGLKGVIGKVLNELELKKKNYRISVGLGRIINKKINYNELKENIIHSIDKYEFENKEHLSKELSSSIDYVFSEIKLRETHLENILFIYERQATLGKIVGELMHEIKQPLSYFKGKTKRIEQIYESLNELMKYNETIIEFRDISINYKENSLRILKFLKNIEPLANNNRKEEFFSINDAINFAFLPFENLLNENNILLNTNIDGYKIYGDKTDFIVAIANFIDNSIYWLNLLNNVEKKEINLTCEINDENLILLFSDNGVGLLKNELKEDIFEPGVTLKEKGTGLGLSIAGEVLKRNNISLGLLESGEGFTLKLIIEKWKK